MTKVECVRMRESATLPSFAHDYGDAAADLYSADEITEILPAERKLIGTGIALAIPVGYGGFIWDRSGLALNRGLTVLGGVIDSNYRGEIGVVLLNTGQEAYYVGHGERIAQIAFFPVWTP